MTDNKKDPIRFTLRLDPELHKKLQADAEKNGRSLHAEMIKRLEFNEASVTFPLGMAVKNLKDAYHLLMEGVKEIESDDLRQSGKSTKKDK